MVWSWEEEAERPPLSVILPRLYLGAERDVTQERLSSLGISYVLSVSRCSPRPSFLPRSRFLRIPIDDSLWDDLLPWIPQALHFIDAAMSSGAAVLVHCAAGISRSPALAVAYIMYRLGMDLDHAYRFVKERRPSISPNFNFLGQLQHFQSTLSSKQPVAELLSQPPPSPSPPPQPLPISPVAFHQSSTPTQSPAPPDHTLPSDNGEQRLSPGDWKQQQLPAGSSSLLDRRKSLTLSLMPIGGHTPSAPNPTSSHSPAPSHSISQREAGGALQALTPTGPAHSTKRAVHITPGPAHSTQRPTHSMRSPTHSEVKQQSLLSPLSFTLNKLLDWGERLLLGGALVHPVRMGQSALSYRC